MTERAKPIVSKAVLLCVTVALWLVVCAAVEVPRIAASATVVSTGDAYAHTWPFQLMVFGVFRFPLWLIGLLLVVALEIALLTRRTPTDKAAGSNG
jgi:hypothetical protein